MTNAGRKIPLSSIIEALRAAGMDGVFLVRETSPGVVELEHNRLRESMLHVQTDLFDACRALERAGFEAFELGHTIIVRPAAAAEARPSLAKTTDDEGNGSSKVA